LLLSQRGLRLPCLLLGLESLLLLLELEGRTDSRTEAPSKTSGM